MTHEQQTDVVTGRKERIEEPSAETPMAPVATTYSKPELKRLGVLSTVAASTEGAWLPEII